MSAHIAETYAGEIKTVADALSHAAFVRNHGGGACGLCRHDSRHWQQYKQQALAEEALLILAEAARNSKEPE